MSSSTRRYRSSTAASSATPPTPTEITDSFHKALHTINYGLDHPSKDRAVDITKATDGLRHTRDQIRFWTGHSSTEKPQDVLRHLDVFPTILRTIRAASGSYNPTKADKEVKDTVFGLLYEALFLLADVLRGHQGNRRYFKKRVEGGGWIALEQAIASIGIGGSDLDSTSQSRLFGILLAFALDDESLGLVFDVVKFQLTSKKDRHNSERSVEQPDTKNAQQSSPTTPESEDFSAAATQSLVEEALGSDVDFVNPEIAPTIIEFWRRLPRKTTAASIHIPFCLLAALSAVCDRSQSNLLALHSTGILSTILPLAFEDDTEIPVAERLALEKLCRSLMSLGLTSLDDARYLLTSKSPRAGEFMLQMTKTTQTPPHIQFDLSLTGYSSIELPTLGRQFPPPSSSPGYTFCSWIYVDRFDETSHTTIFGAFDNSQTCFVLIYLEKDTHNLILQTSVTSSRPSVRFKSTVFKEKKWYHVAIVHRRARALTASKAALYIDGEFVEQVKANYPSAPPPSNASTESFASFVTSTTKTKPVQTFFGTPQELSTMIKPNAVFSKWSLASAHLYEDALSDDTIAVQYTLGPRYKGNFQDSLGSFLTYEASTKLGIRNQLVHPGKEGKSDIVVAAREKAGAVMPESRLLVSILPTATFGEDIQGEVDMSQLVDGLAAQASRNFYRHIHGSGFSIAINAAVPALNDALVLPNGVATLRGGPVVIIPQALDDAMWRLGGCTGIGLKIVELSESKEDVLRAVEIFFESIKGSWRNSEAMERDNGYAILATLLRTKLSTHSLISPIKRVTGKAPSLDTEDRDQLSFQLLSVVLGFIGYNHAKPEESMIDNPLAYRTLLADFEIWRKSGIRTQKLYYKQFITFSVESVHHTYNAHRMSRMKIVKRLVNALKAESFSHDVFPSFIEALQVLVQADLSAEVLRLLALFVTYAIHQPSSVARTPKVRRPTSSRSLAPPRSTSGETIMPVSFPPTAFMTKREIGRAVLQMYTGVLCSKGSKHKIEKFAKTVTTKWLLHLLTEDDADIVVPATKILSRLIVVHGPKFVKKLQEPSGAFTIMKYRLKRWWDLSVLYPIVFSILFNVDIATMDLSEPFDLAALSTLFRDKTIAYPEALPIIIAMLQQGLNTVVNSQSDEGAPNDTEKGANQKDKLAVLEVGRFRSLSLGSNQSRQTRQENKADQTEIILGVVKFFKQLHVESQSFRDFALTSDYVRMLLGALYPVIVSAEAVSAEKELNAKNSVLNFDGEDVIINSTSTLDSLSSPVIRASCDLEPSASTVGYPVRPHRSKPLRRGSSYVMLASTKFFASPAKLAGNHRFKQGTFDDKSGNIVTERLLDLVIRVFVDQILGRKEFAGFNLYLKIPPGFQEHQLYCESYILRQTLTQISDLLESNEKLMVEPRIISNLGRLALHVGEAVYDGWFLGGTEPLLDFLGRLSDFYQQPQVLKLKGVQLCSNSLQTIKSVFFRVILQRLSEIDNTYITEQEAVGSLVKLLYFQTIFLSQEANRGDFFKLLCYQLYWTLIDERKAVRNAGADLWRSLLVQKPDEIKAILVMSMVKQSLVVGFKKITELDNDTFLEWIEKHKADLDKGFYGALSKPWEEFVDAENEKTAETTRLRVSRRKDKLRQWNFEEKNDEDIIMRHGFANSVWCKNIYAAEHLKHLRILQDQQDNLAFLASEYAKMDRDLQRPCAVFDNGARTKWRLDQTEGRNRMRMRLIPDRTELEEYQPKQRRVEIDSSAKSVKSIGPSPSESGAPTPPPLETDGLPVDGSLETPTGASEMESSRFGPDRSDSQSPGADEFELIEDPNEPVDDNEFEDRQRKVMRSLQRGDQVQHVYNTSRIIGLEACEGLLILGRDCLYLIDDFFQREDGEIVNVWDAPSDERDPYVQMISGTDVKEKPAARAEQESRSWKWSEVLSVSKRRFLFRDVAVELFFTDGRSYLLTALNQTIRNDLHAKMTSKAPQLNDKTAITEGDDAWRMESLKSTDDAPVTFGSRLAGLMNNTAWNPSMRRWARGEISNFHYLMLVNTMAGRTFNDLTQYPVFPWIIADYTSEELDLNNPATFRDLSKPMGCQNPVREAGFKERYKTFAEMGEKNPFHYGTHYTSAMIVASFLIRLQPYVQSYLLIQGGNFDHPDRIFHSIGKTWESASQNTMTDVRELTPEFFYLPEFLVNSNGFNFGQRQGDGGSVDNVELPPWAKGDPKIFIAKNREALESPYVTAHLHEWIDLVFGCKQNGEAAVENTNVFHHLSYRGATDLDAIEDHHEKLQTISIIHNFGQTPHQVFTKPHQPHEEWHNKIRRLDTSAQSLTRLPFPSLKLDDYVSTIVYSPKLDRLICGTPFRIYMPPNFDKVVEWGYADNSIRVYSAVGDSKKQLGLIENTHQGQLSAMMFIDSKTLVTAGVDCVLSIWDVKISSSSKAIGLEAKTSLFGHRQPVSTIAVCRSFSTLLSASTDGTVILWDLNRLEFVRKLTSGRSVQAAAINSVSGDILLIRGQKAALYTLNGDLILDQRLAEGDDYIFSCAFYEGAGNEWLENQLVFTGHKRGVVNVWRKVVGRDGKWKLELLKCLEHVAVERGKRDRTGAAVTSICATPSGVFTGDEDGMVNEWACVVREK